MIEDPELGIDYSRVVHGDQKFTYTRPVRAGDRPHGRPSRSTTVRSAGGHDMITSAARSPPTSGEHVVNRLVHPRGPRATRR